MWQLAWQAKEQARGRGGNRIVTQADLAVANKLPNAIERREFSLALQPQLELESHTLTGVEFLLRWEGLDIGSLSPDRFIAVAEQSGQMVRIGDWVLREAVRTQRDWPNTVRPLTLSVNTAPAQFQQDLLFEQIRRLHTELGLAPHRLELELNHKNLLYVIDHHRNTLYRLRDLGVRIAIDNLGAHLIEPDTLLRCPADTLKIDRQLIAHIEQTPAAAVVVEQLAELGRRFRLKTVAVGVESAAQLEQVKQRGCSHAQGFYLYPPLSAADFRAVLYQHTDQVAR